MLRDKKKDTPIKKHIRSHMYAWKGLYEILMTELNFQILLFFSLLTIMAGLFFRLNSIEWIILVFTITLLLISEAFNKSIETTCDAICVEYREQIRYAKDVAAGAVLLATLLSIFVVLIIFVPYLVDYLKIAFFKT
jgi:undecaprenol kinase